MCSVERKTLPRQVRFTQARNLSPVFDEAVRREHPVVIVRGRREKGLLLSLEAMRRVLTPYKFHVNVIPEAAGGFTLWLRELNVAATGPTLKEARHNLLRAIRSHIDDYFADFEFYRHLSDMAAQEPFVLCLSLADCDDELIEMLFGPAGREEKQAPGNSAEA